MKKKFLLFVLLPTLLTSCNMSNWYEVNAEKGRAIADNIIRHYKQNRPVHAIENFETCTSDGSSLSIAKSYAAYNLDQYCRVHLSCETNITEIGISKIKINRGITRVENNKIIGTILRNDKIETITRTYEDNKTAKKEFEEIYIDQEFSSYDMLIDIINTPISYHNEGVATNNPLVDGYSKILAKNNDSLDVKSTFYSTTYDMRYRVYSSKSTECSIIVKNYQCLEYKNFAILDNDGDQTIRYELMTYDYDTPIHFDNIEDLIELEKNTDKQQFNMILMLNCKN